MCENPTSAHRPTRLCESGVRASPGSQCEGRASDALRPFLNVVKTWLSILYNPPLITRYSMGKSRQTLIRADGDWSVLHASMR